MSVLKYALVIDDIVTNILDEDPTGQFEPGLLWVPFNPSETICEVGYKYISLTNKFEKPRLPLEQEKLNLLKFVNDTCDDIYYSILKDYPESEVNTFDRQESEARDFVRNVDRKYIFIEILSSIRGLSQEEMARRIILKSDYIAPYLATNIANRQHFEDQICECNSHNELDQVGYAILQWRLENLGEEDGIS